MRVGSCGAGRWSRAVDEEVDGWVLRRRGGRGGGCEEGGVERICERLGSFFHGSNNVLEITSESTRT